MKQSSDRELLEAYPHCRVAVAYVELLICRSESGEQTTWDLMMQAEPPMTLEDVIGCIQHAMDGETECRAEEALRQTEHPSFRQYIVGKMGMM